MVNIGINGFGRIGRLVLRVALLKHGVDVVAINDLFMDLQTMAYLFKYDSVHGRFPGTVEHTDNCLVIDGKRISVYRCGKPDDIPWKVHDVDVVVEATSVFAIVDRCKPHLTAGAKRVIITTPSADAPPFVCGVNDTQYQSAVHGPIISASSATVACLAPLLKVVDEAFGVVDGTLTVLHSVASGQKAVDGPLQKDWRGGRSLLNNIIPSTNGSATAKAVGRVLPQLNNKISGPSLERSLPMAPRWLAPPASLRCHLLATPTTPPAPTSPRLALLTPSTHARHRAPRPHPGRVAHRRDGPHLPPCDTRPS